MIVQKKRLGELQQLRLGRVIAAAADREAEPLFRIDPCYGQKLEALIDGFDRALPEAQGLPRERESFFLDVIRAEAFAVRVEIDGPARARSASSRRAPSDA